MRIVIAAMAAFLFLSGCDNGDSGAGPAARTPFDAGTEGLPDAVETPTLVLRDGDTVRLTLGFVAKMAAGHKIRMLAYNGSVPGPLLKLRRGARITLLLTNTTGLPTTLHSHGVRVENASDGIPDMTQASVDSGETFAYNLHFPDAGMFWYHPHYREDYQQAMGLYGNYWVEDSIDWPAVHREIPLMLGDIFLDENGASPYYQEGADHVLMGRFGNTLLVNGDTAPTWHVRRNEVVRFYATNAATARVFNLKFTADVGLNVIGGDNGLFRTPVFSDNALIAPSERLIFQVWMHDPFEAWDTLELRHSTPSRDYLLARFVYDEEEAAPDLSSSLGDAENAAVAADVDAYRKYFDHAPDKEISLISTMDMSGMDMSGMAKRSAVADDPNAGALGIEWSDNMGAMNSGSTPANTRWIIRDSATGKENHDIHWIFARGAPALIRIHNDPGGMHPMPHPIHFHGQRFLVVRENGKPPPWDLGWKDTYLIGKGYTVDILLDNSNPGNWMFHCHIPEHMQSDMMAHFTVE
jgi:suppressor of ftsI